MVVRRGQHRCRFQTHTFTLLFAGRLSAGTGVHSDTGGAKALSRTSFDRRCVLGHHNVGCKQPSHTPCVQACEHKKITQSSANSRRKHHHNKTTIKQQEQKHTMDTKRNTQDPKKSSGTNHKRDMVNKTMHTLPHKGCTRHKCTTQHAQKNTWS